MGSNLRRNLRWFDRGAAAFAAAVPGAPGAEAQRGTLYACPECIENLESGELRIRLLPRSEVESGGLTAEHVPPKSLGGRELVLTCKGHNNDAGTRLESHARNREKPINALLGDADGPSNVRLTAGPHSLSAAFELVDNELVFDLPPASKHANDPRIVEAFRKSLPALAENEGEIRLQFWRDLFVPERADAAWLRHAYLVMFAVFGYRYVLSRGLGVVREHIRNPEAGKIGAFIARVPKEHSKKERRIMRVREPGWMESWAIQFGRHLVLLPRAGDDGFYSRLEKKRAIGEASTIFGDLVAWPTEPLFGHEVRGK